jgi:hypothetical protein
MRRVSIISPYRKQVLSFVCRFFRWHTFENSDRTSCACGRKAELIARRFGDDATRPRDVCTTDSFQGREQRFVLVSVSLMCVLQRRRTTIRSLRSNHLCFQMQTNRNDDDDDDDNSGMQNDVVLISLVASGRASLHLRDLARLTVLLSR